MKPRVAVVSAGWGNPYGHPSPQTVARLVDSRAKVFRTDLDGSVDISTNGADLVANAGGGGRSRRTRRLATAGDRLLPHSTADPVGYSKPPTTA